MSFMSILELMTKEYHLWWKSKYTSKNQELGWLMETKGKEAKAVLEKKAAKVI